MNKLFLTAILILCLPAATAVTLNMSAGEQEYITLDDSPSSCVMVEDQNNSYSLTDYNTDGLNLTINGTLVTINTNPALKPGNYTLICNYSKEETTSTSSGSSGSSGGYTSSWICGNWSECIDNETGRLCIQGTNKNINYTQTKSCVSETEEPEAGQAPCGQVNPLVMQHLIKARSGLLLMTNAGVFDRNLLDMRVAKDVLDDINSAIDA